jgi:hypothetical protein
MSTSICSIISTSLEEELKLSPIKLGPWLENHMTTSSKSKYLP